MRIWYEGNHKVSAKLVAYEYVPLGFEMVIANTEGKIWNLWYNVQLSDGPEKWDSEIRLINNMQKKRALDHQNK